MKPTEKLYEVAFTYKGHTFSTKVIADSKADAISLASDGLLIFAESWDAKLIALDGVPVNDVPG